MGYDKTKLKQIRNLMFIAAALILALIYSDVIIRAVGLGMGILSPFVAGAAVAFILNLPMNFIERKIFGKWKGKAADKIKRPISMVMSLVFVIVILFLVCITVIPQLSKTIVMLGNQIPQVTEEVLEWLDKLSRKYPQISAEVAKLEAAEFDWAKIGNGLFDFFRNGIGDVVTSTVTVATSILGGVANSVIALIFSLYILSQKERLHSQVRRLFQAYFKESVYEKISHVCSLLYRNFSKFISGQCLEALILGVLFIIAMTIFRMPYAVMIGVLIAFTALIPIVGAFIGCVVGTFLILIVNPMQALVFLIMFLILQQLEGNLIYPKVVGSSVGLPALWVLMAVSVGGSLFGIVGMLAFIPLLSTIYQLLRESVNARNEKKRTAKEAAVHKEQEISKTVPEAEVTASDQEPG